MNVMTLTINGVPLSGAREQTILEVAREHQMEIPTLCYLNGLSEVGACRLCLVEEERTPKLLPACTTKVQEGMNITTHSPRLREYRRMILELLFAERNHVCAVCVSNGHCDLQNQAYDVGMDHVRFPYINPALPIDVTHQRFGIDHNRCVLCTRCVRVCEEIEGAHTWDIMGRGANARVISDLNQPWGTSSTCTSCGKCVQVCPTGALFTKGASAAEMVKQREFVAYLQHAREKKQHDGF